MEGRGLDFFLKANARVGWKFLLKILKIWRTALLNTFIRVLIELEQKAKSASYSSIKRLLKVFIYCTQFHVNSTFNSNINLIVRFLIKEFELLVIVFIFMLTLNLSDSNYEARYRF